MAISLKQWKKDHEGETPEMTICAECRHYRGGRIWYDQRCSSPEVQPQIAIHPQTGEPAYCRTNDLGKRYWVGEDAKNPYAREINPDGNCQHYQTPDMRASK